MQFGKAASNAAAIIYAGTSLYRSAAGRTLRLLAVMAITAAVANCGSQKVGGIDPKYGVAPSPRVVAEGEQVPKGGGRALIGRPYVVAGRTYVPHDARG